jgi:hypothetical protein
LVIASSLPAVVDVEDRALLCPGITGTDRLWPKRRTNPRVAKRRASTGPAQRAGFKDKAGRSQRTARQLISKRGTSATRVEFSLNLVHQRVRQSSLAEFGEVFEHTILRLR